MKKILFIASSLFVLMACSKDRSMEEEDVTVKTSSIWQGNGVHILNSAFSPDSLTVNINNNVYWVNDDAITHSVTSDQFDSGDVPAGSAFKYYFDHTGSYNYQCRYHGEKGVIVVTGIR